MSFSARLRVLIEERDITQKNLAAELHIPPSTLGGYVQGTSEPDFETLKLFVRYFKVSADYLLDIPESRTNSSKESELLRVFRNLPSEQQELFIEQGKAIIRYNTREAKTSSAFQSENKAV